MSLPRNLRAAAVLTITVALGTAALIWGSFEPTTNPSLEPIAEVESCPAPELFQPGFSLTQIAAVAYEETGCVCPREIPENPDTATACCKLRYCIMWCQSQGHDWAHLDANGDCVCDDLPDPDTPDTNPV